MVPLKFISKPMTFDSGDGCTFHFHKAENKFA